MTPWLRWTLLALFSWGLWAIIAKLIGDALSGTHTQALSTLGILPIMAALGCSVAAETRRRSNPVAAEVIRRIRPASQSRGILYALASGAVSCVGNVFFYDALARGGKAALIVPLTALYPLATILLAALLLKERLNRIQLAGVFLSLLAIYLFNVRHEQQVLSGWLLYALVPIGLWGASGFLQKLSTNHISGELSTLWFLGAFIPFAVFFLLGQSLPARISPQTWGLVLAQGFFLALGNFAILLAFARQGKASIIAPLAALYPVVSVPIAIVFLGEKIMMREAFGILLGLASMAALTYEPQPEPQPQVASARGTGIGTST